MMIGMDYPHHDGTLIEGTQNYLRATLGAANVPVDEARRMLGDTAARVFGFDLAKLDRVARRIGIRPADVLTPPDRDLYARGDVNRPGSFFG